jgi:peptidoglycan/LPS O-acetylase OafA/YrhL
MATTARASADAVEARAAVGPPRGRGRQLAYQPALDGLRGVAVFAVLLFHAGHLQGGFLGVDLFFTLSGFLITTLLLVEHERSGRISLKSFWGRRARRLLPALYLLLAATIGYAAVFARPDALRQIRGDAYAALAYVANWHLIARGGDYWSNFAAPSPLEHLWSLAVEEQFYIVWPLLVIGLLAWAARRGRDGRRALLAVGVSLTALSSAWMLVLSLRGASATRIYFGTDTRASSILVGAVTAMLMASRGDRVRAIAARPGARRVAAAVTVLLVIGLGVTWSRVDGSTSLLLYRGGFLLHAVVVAVLIVVVSVAPLSPLARVLGSTPLRSLGLISYGVYLWHWPVYLVLTESRVHVSGWALVALRIAVSLAVAILNYRLLEIPIRAGALRGPTLGVATAVSVAAIVGGVWLATIPPDHVVAAAPPPTVTRAPTATIPAPATTAGPTAAGAPPTVVASTAAPTTAAPAAQLLRTRPAIAASQFRVRTPTAADPLRVLLFGDSYMYDASPGMAAALDATGMVAPTESGLFGFSITEGEWQKVIRERLDQYRPELVVAQWARFDEAWLDEHGADAYLLKLREAIGLMVDHGASVAVVGLAPSQTDGLDTAPVARHINALFQTMPAAFPGKVIYVDPDPIVAPDGRPHLSIDGPTGSLRVRKADLSHFCPDGSARFGQALTTLLSEVAAVPVPDPSSWAYGTWRADPRFDDPHGACS